ncbi:TPA: hypothetical protein LAP77_001536 [Escherichia coli]|nr:hypothetical protein [Escherichia coli]
MIKRPNRSTLCLAEGNGIEPSSLEHHAPYSPAVVVAGTESPAYGAAN